MMDYIKILLRIQRLGLVKGSNFSVSLVELLYDLFPVKACTFYTLSSDRKKLILRGQQGFSYDDYSSFELPLNTLVGQAYISKNIVRESSLADHELYRDKNLVEKYDLNTIDVIPILRWGEESNEVQTIGVLCLYPLDRDYREMADLIVLQEMISGAYLHSFERTKSEARDKVVSAISKASDLNSALHKVIHVLASYVEFEAGSIFLYGETRKLLHLHATTGIKTESNLFKHDIVYSKKDYQTYTWQAFESGTIIPVSKVLDKTEVEEKHKETVDNRYESLLVLPISRLDKADSGRERQGVLRCVNKTICHDSTYERISFTYEDLEILAFLSEIIGLTCHIFTQRDNRISYFEKIMHGTKANIHTSIQNLDFLERRGDLEKRLPAELHFTISDTKEWLDDIKNQMHRLESSEVFKPKLESIHLGTRILINSVRLFEKSAQTRDIKRAEITRLSDFGFFKIPNVVGDEKLLMLVFRNLVENALKYRDHKKETCEVTLKHSIDSDYIYISFIDNGIGIPEKLWGRVLPFAKLANG
jgi:signal transduction histidine kinase